MEDNFYDDIDTSVIPLTRLFKLNKRSIIESPFDVEDVSDDDLEALEVNDD
jgi:hypothetical protein